MEHVPKTKDELLAILDDMRGVVAADDSFEGSIEYLLADTVGNFAVRASYRIGNRMGQGGIRLVGSTS